MFFKPKKMPIDSESRHWVEEQGEFIFKLFGEDYLKTKPFIMPDNNFYGLKYKGCEWDGNYLAYKVAEVMDISPQCIDLEFVDDDGYVQLLSNFSFAPTQVVSAAGTYSEDDPEASYHSSLYGNGKKKYYIKIKKSLLKRPMALVSTIAHEFSHIKLLGEKGMFRNDENLTDLLPVFFGLGIFSSIGVTPFTGNGGVSKLGYLTPSIYGYAMALWAFHKKEDCNKILRSLNGTTKDVFKKCIKYINANGYIFWNPGITNIQNHILQFLKKK